VLHAVPQRQLPNSAGSGDHITPELLKQLVLRTSVRSCVYSDTLHCCWLSQTGTPRPRYYGLLLSKLPGLLL
jgi:hypothetical protein